MCPSVACSPSSSSSRSASPTSWSVSAGGHLSLYRRVLGCRPRHDARRLPARVPPGRRQSSIGRPGAGGGAHRSLGMGRIRTFWTGDRRTARVAILGGAILVGLVVLAEFGGLRDLGYQTFTTEIYNEFQVGFNQPAACALSLSLSCSAGCCLASEDTVEGVADDRLDSGPRRRGRPSRRTLGRARWPWPASAGADRAGHRSPGRVNPLPHCAGRSEHACRRRHWGSPP